MSTRPRPTLLSKEHSSWAWGVFTRGLCQRSDLPALWAALPPGPSHLVPLQARCFPLDRPLFQEGQRRLSMRGAAGRPLCCPPATRTPWALGDGAYIVPISSGLFGAPGLGLDPGALHRRIPHLSAFSPFLPLPPHPSDPPSSSTASGTRVFPALCPRLSIFFISLFCPFLWCVQRVSEAHLAPSLPAQGSL